MNSLVVLAIVGVLLVAAVVIYRVLRKSKVHNPATWQPSKSESSNGAAKEQKDQAQGELDVLFGSLADHLLALRISGASQAVYSATWQVISDLVMLLPKLTEEYGKAELTFVLTQVGKKYLPNLIVPFGKLSPGAMAGKEAELLSALAVLSEEVQKVQGIYDRGEVNRFETEAIFLRNKFLGETIEAE